MRQAFIRKIHLFPFFGNSRTGAVTAAAALLSLAFTALALGMLFAAQIELKINGSKKHMHILELASENGIKQGFDLFTQLLKNRPSPQKISPVQRDFFQQDCSEGETAMLEYFLASPIPFHYQGKWDRMYWSGSTEFLTGPVRQAEGYFKVDFPFVISSFGRVNPSPVKKKKSLSGFLSFFCGRIPLASLPLAVQQDALENPSAYLQEKKITLSHPRNPEPVQPFITEEPLIPDIPIKTLEKALKTHIFRPQDLTARRLRDVLGLEESDEPVPDGVYLIQDDLGLGGVFVQGNVREIILAVSGGFQSVHFSLDAGTWLLKINPVLSKTQFVTPDQDFHYNLIPLGIIIINGEVQSIGGGIETPSGEYQLVTDREIPCVLNSIRLTFISTKEVTITSHLLQEGVDWKEGIPYVKDGTSQLNIFAAGTGLGDAEGGEGSIILSGDAPQDVKIHASLTASKGFHFQEENQNLTLFGGLHTSEINNPSSSMHILTDDRYLKYPGLLQDSPRSRSLLLRCVELYIKEWNENA